MLVTTIGVDVASERIPDSGSCIAVSMQSRVNNTKLRRSKIPTNEDNMFVFSI